MIKLFLIFLYTGFVAFGGGLATIPILYQIVVDAGMITEEKFYNMIAISQATPGPIGLNLATYVGYNQGGFWGAMVASIAIVTSSIFFVSIFARIYNKVKNNKNVTKSMKGIRAAIVGVIIVAVLKILKLVIIEVPNGIVMTGITEYLKSIDYNVIMVIIAFLLLMRKFKGSFIKYIILGGVVGIFIF